jgi:hypothetical protein
MEKEDDAFWVPLTLKPLKTPSNWAMYHNHGNEPFDPSTLEDMPPAPEPPQLDGLDHSFTAPIQMNNLLTFCSNISSWAANQCLVRHRKAHSTEQ